MITMLLEQALLEAETEVSVLKHRVVPAVVESTSSTNSHTDASTQDETMPMRAQFTVSELEMMLREPLLSNFGHTVLAKVLDTNDGSREFVLNAAFSAFLLMATTEEETISETKDSCCTLFALLVWCVEAALATFFNSPVKDVAPIHVAAFWEIVTALLRSRGADAHELTKGARLIERKGRQCGDGLALKALNVAKMLVAHSTVAAVVFGAGCNGGIALFRKPSPPNFHARR